MKKTRFIAVVLIVAVMAIGAGYAYWTQELNIKGTVETGELKVEFVELECLKDHGGYDNILCPCVDDYINVDLNMESNRLSASFENIYPGAGGYIRFRIANTGTVPAVVKGITPENVVGRDLLDEFEYIIHSLRVYTPKFKTLPVGFDWRNWKWIYENFDYTDIAIEGLPIHANNFDDFVAILADRLDNHVLQPYAFFEINGEGSGYDIILDGKNTSNESMPQGETLGFDLLINFEQRH